MKLLSYKLSLSKCHKKGCQAKYNDIIWPTFVSASFHEDMAAVVSLEEKEEPSPSICQGSVWLAEAMSRQSRGSNTSSCTAWGSYMNSTGKFGEGKRYRESERERGREREKEENMPYKHRDSSFDIFILNCYSTLQFCWKTEMKW